MVANAFNYQLIERAFPLILVLVASVLMVLSILDPSSWQTKVPALVQGSIALALSILATISYTTKQKDAK